ncbi:MAG: hypothetical protein LAT68_15975 [Cyclobacteriaceae bacterium]|nr:hypothetical protein [Cyclobacteriaceae bacterium]MCH8517817.1 hypothetical protein [Cyclobacteriaceae bacterium]
MYTGLQHGHSGLAYPLLLALIIAIGYAAFSLSQNKERSKANKITALVALILTHLQLLIGLVLYFVSPKGLSNFGGDAMKDSLSRLYIVEHPLTMIIAIVLITVGYATAKRTTEDKASYKKILIFYSIGLFLILLRIPWQVWPGGGMN